MTRLLAPALALRRHLPPFFPLWLAALALAGGCTAALAAPPDSPAPTAPDSPAPAPASPAAALQDAAPQDAAASDAAAPNTTPSDSATPNAPPTPAASQADADDAADASPAFDIRVESEHATLRERVQRHTELQRYRAVPDLSDSELNALMRLAERDVRNLLGAEGYFNPKVRITLERGDAKARPVVLIRIDPGPPARVQRAQVEFEGELATTADADALTQRQAIVSDWGLPEGAHFTQDSWSSAKTDALRRLVQRRYPRGRISYSLADVNAPASQAALLVRLDSGPAYRLGAPQVKGASRYPPELAARLSWLREGQVYDQKDLIDAQQRLAGSGYYDSAYIAIDPDGEPDAAPVIYTVTEAKRHKLQLGVGYSTDGGPRLSLEHRDNTAFGTRWRMDTRLHLDRKEPLLQVELSSLPTASLWRWGALARHMRQDDGSLVTTSQTLRVGRLQNTLRYDRHLYLQYDHANVTVSGNAQVPQALLGDGSALSANLAWTGRYFNQLPAPTQGYGLSAEIGAGFTTFAPRKPFLRLKGRALGLIPIRGGSSRLALRGELGAVLAADEARLPSTYLFRTGGDTTVRGYAYRRIGLDVGQNLIAPGRYMVVASAEWQRPILRERFGDLLEHTLFIDVGSVANRVSDLRAHWGIGTGLRLNTPVGPMALALAYGLKTREVRLHLTVGFSF